MAGTINEFTLLAEAQKFLNDYDAKWFGSDTAEVYRGFLLDHVLGDEQAYELNKRGTGIYTYNTGQSPVAVLCTDSPQFTAETGVTYRLYAKGLKIYVTVGAATATSITVNAVPVNFREATAVLYEWMAAHKAQVEDESLGGATISGGETAARLLNIAAHIRGPMGI
ncbi:MAG TPA: hypothetical protein VM223_27170 [Planctomycetota bacterium]|nr:hypothetical protein [Planctomycetota bacterium]